MPSLEVETLSLQVTGFENRLTALFTQGLGAETVFTKVALEHLQTAKMIKLRNGQFRCLGETDAVTQSDIAEALTSAKQKTRSWADLALFGVGHRVSKLRIVGAFSVFWLDDSIGGTTKERRTHRCQSMARGA